MTFAAWFLTLSLALQSTGGSPPQAQHVVLRTGEEAELDSGRIRVRFEAVLSDSRCPRGHQCVRAGEAKVRIWAQEGSEPGRSHVVAGPARTYYSVSRHYSIQITALEPYPVAGAEKPAEYTLTLAVR
jgi:hypothetical protein